MAEVRFSFPDDAVELAERGLRRQRGDRPEDAKATLKELLITQIEQVVEDQAIHEARERAKAMLGKA